MQVTYLSVGDLGTNCCFAYDDAGNAVVIDPAAEAQRLLNIVKENNLSVHAILLTHAHFDHILAADTLREATGAPLCVGAEDATMLADARKNLSGLIYPFGEVSLIADRLLREGDTVSFGTETLTVLETPGHTPGSVCYVGDGVLFAGDTLFAGSIGRTDLPGGDMRVLRRSLERLVALEEDYAIYAGHGEQTTLAYEKRANPYLSSL